MKRLLPIILIFIAACSDAQLASLRTGLANFRAGVAEVNATIAEVSNELYANCTSLQSFVSGLSQVIGGQKEKQAFATGNAVIVRYCQAPPQNIASAVLVTAQAVKDAKAAYKAAGGK